jgi:alkyldihydroxyacetonephosphate synthase
MENGNSYRHILKWGDKHEEGVSHHMAEVIKEKFDLSDADFKGKHLPGTEPVKLEKPSMLKPVQVDFFRSVSGAENILTDDMSRARFSCGKFYGELLDLRLGLVPDPPDAVVAPRTHEEVEKIISFCSGEGIAVVPAGGLSSVTGAVRAPGGGIAIDLTKHLNKVLAVNKLNKTVTVQAGMYGPALEESSTGRVTAAVTSRSRLSIQPWEAGSLPGGQDRHRRGTERLKTCWCQSRL